MRRRDFVKNVCAGSGVCLAGCPVSQGQLQQGKKPPEPYGAQYYEKAYEIWERESSTELPLISEAADRAAWSLKNGRRLHSHVIFGHMLEAEFREDRAGNPNYLPNWTRNSADEEYGALGEGDFLFFDFAKQRVRAARDRGVFTVGIRVPYLPNKTIPPGVLFTGYSLYDGTSTEECSSIVLTPGVPFTDGVLPVPEIPAVRACPISVQGAGILYWMLTAAIAMRDRGGGARGSGEKALEYINIVKERGGKIRAELDHFDAVAKTMTDCVSRGGRYWNFSHGCEFAIENYIRASGIAMSQLIGPDDMMGKVKPEDFAIIAGEFSAVRENVDMAKALKSKGVTVISIGPTHTESSSGDDLSSIADWHIDTCSPERDGVVTIPGFDRKICPTTGILYALALWMLNGQFIERMIEADMVPGLDMGVHLLGGRGYNSAVRPVVAERGF